MNLFDTSALDIQCILTNTNEGGRPVTFTPPVGDPVVINCMAIMHHMAVDDVGRPTSSLTARVTVSTLELARLSYTYRNSSGQVALTGHTVSWVDPSGVTRTFIVQDEMAGESNGIIVLNLSK